MSGFFDPHIHMYSRTTDDYDAMSKAGIEVILFGNMKILIILKYIFYFSIGLPIVLPHSSHEPS